MNRRATPLHYRPGLDGLRGIAVIGVLLYHSQFTWARGGFLGVSAFFTLSGFLITTLLLRESNAHGAIDLVRFWGRRFRRLLPAALLGILAALVYIALVADNVAVDQFRGDAMAALYYVANWRFVANELSYAELFTSGSPVQHFWSLAIEEQFYVVYPVVFAGLLAAARGRRGPVAVSLGVLLAGSVMLSLAFATATGGDRVYYGTDTRAAELLVGALLALVFERWPDVGRRVRQRETAVRHVAAPAALVVMAVLWSQVEQTTSWLHPWGLLFHAGLTALVIREAVATGPLSFVLSFEPLRRLGQLSYGVYVYHWPIFLYLSPARYPDLDGSLRLVLRLGLTLAVATLSYVVIEEPVRRGRLKLGPVPPLVPLATVTGCAVLVAAVTLVIDRPPPTDFAQSTAIIEAERTEDDAPLVEDAIVVSVFGDSTSLLVATGLKVWSFETGLFDVVEGYTPLGCGIGRGGRRQIPGFELHDNPEGCDWTEPWANQLAVNEPTVAVVLFGSWDAIDRQLEGETVLRTIGDPVYDEYLIGEVRAATALLLEQVDTVVWLTAAPPAAITKGPDDPLIERIEAFNRLVFAALNETEGVRFVDLRAWVQQWPGGFNDLALRPDGTHFSDESAVWAAEWIAPAIQAAVDAPSGRVIEPDDVVPIPVP